MAVGTITMQVKVAWWLWPYFNTLIFFCLLFGTEPDREKLDRVIERAITLGPPEFRPTPPRGPGLTG